MGTMITHRPLKQRSVLPLPARRLLAVAGILAVFGQIGWVATPKAVTVDGSPPPRHLQDIVPSWSLDPGPVPATSPSPHRLFHLPVIVTGYSSTPDQTDDTPFVTAANTPVRPGVLALSRDLLREFTPGAPFRFGDRVELEGIGIFVVEDTMHPRYTKRADIWFANRAAAAHWGRRNLNLVQLGPEARTHDLFASAPPSPHLFETAFVD
jgi:3D (Asp-Asp-Asp) domain-containing protein